MGHNEDREFQIKLREHKIKVQMKMVEYSPLTALVLSSMVVIAFTFYTWAITQNYITYIYAGVVVAFVFGLVSLQKRYVW